MKPTISVVICVMDRADDLIRCLKSLKKQTLKKIEIIAVDNGQKSMKGIARKFGARYIKSDKIMNTCHARNLGWKNSKGRIVAYIDDDGIAERQWLSSIVREYKNNVGGVGGKILLPRETNLLEDEIKNAYGVRKAIITLFTFLIDYRGKGRITNSGQITSLDSLNRTTFVDYIQGCNMSFRKELLQRINGFDERLSSGYPFRDDTDVSVRIRKLGYKIVFSKNAKVFHNLGKPSSNPKFSRRSYAIKQLEHLYFVYKNRLITGLIGHIKFYVQQLSEIVLYLLVSFERRDISIFKGVVAGKSNYLAWRFLNRDVFK